MNYQGPAAFKRIVEDEYLSIRHKFNRTEGPTIIAGDIQRIDFSGSRAAVTGDAVLNGLIDEAHSHYVRNPSTIDAYSNLEAACADASTVPGDTFGGYNTPTDFVLINPVRIARYLALQHNIVSLCVALGNGNDVMIAANFRHFFAHEMAHYDFGDTAISREIQRVYCGNAPPYEKGSDAAFRYDGKHPTREGHLKMARLATKNPQSNRLAPYHELAAKREELGLRDFEEAIAIIAGFAITPPKYIQVPINIEQSLSERLIKLAETEGPRKFLAMMKEKENEAYASNRNVFKLI